ncbi:MULTISPECIES: hypothetical protein [unclassified Streptomyces]|uniref:hypothetical protein n=1 Tax=unclassified Streptomyces TaxID=2593676 RepID=UPI00364BB744
MNLGTLGACIVISVGFGVLLWGVLLTLSCLREYRRKITIEVEILDTLKLSTGLSYRFSPVNGDTRLDRSVTETDWIASTPRKFGDRKFSMGEAVSIDYDPGYPAFFYPAGEYPVIRLWPITLLASMAGAATVGLGVVALM